MERGRERQRERAMKREAGLSILQRGTWKPTGKIRLEQGMKNSKPIE